MDSTSVPLVCVTRSGVQDNLHRGAVVVVDDAGGIALSFGDPGARGYIRSSAKPIQALPVIACGAAEAFGFDDADVAIMCGSHAGGEPQVAQVRSMLSKAGLTEGQVKSGSGIADNCSGKHAGMLATSRHLGHGLEDYLDPGHPHQRSILEVLSRVCAVEAADITIGVDGCGAPIHYVRILDMARGYARMSRPERHFDGPTAAAVERVTRAMAANAGGHTGEPDYAGMLGGARLLTKAGGNGVYCAGVVGRGIGFAMKVEDGSAIPLRPVFTEVMRRLGVITDDEARALAGRVWPPVVNRRGTVVGEIQLLLPA